MPRRKQQAPKRAAGDRLSGDRIVSPRGRWWMGSFEGVRAAGREKGDCVPLDLSSGGARADTFLTTRHLSKVNSRQLMIQRMLRRAPYRPKTLEVIAQ
ncbi:uncharacterized protein tshz3a isoform X3 [Carassius carassius]|uniref:uncharacterized protein tshz3a isoform X3 n=1 Tax=Carassius carassius TaxID=217509 RepID=UPI0028686AB2|nr:uncharacterized protein tshz3a isoform X3 [Carassius carassius]